MSSVPTPLTCSLDSQRSLTDKLNAEWHKPALLTYTAIVLIHWSEHLAQAFQVYILGWPLKEARGVLGMPFPWLVGSEALHYGYALIMLVAFWTLRKGFVGRSYYWWMAAFWIQFWHHIEHALLQYQVVSGDNFFGAPAPISLIQMLGFLEGTPGTGFGGLMTGPPQHPFSALMIAVRRLEVHLFYNSIVTIPMVVAMFYHMFPSPGEEAHMGCNCVWHRKVPVGKAPWSEPMRVSSCRSLLAALLVFVAWPAAGCQRPSRADGAADVKLDLTLRPNPPLVGSGVAVVKLTGMDDKPVTGGTVKLEGNMNHAGMKPVFADAKETQPGQYEGTLELTMGGDWFVLINATLADGRKLSRKVDIPGVKSR